MTKRLIAALASAVLMVSLAAAVPATGQTRIKPKVGDYVPAGGPNLPFLTVARDRRTATVGVSLWCGSKLQPVDVGKVRLKNVGRRSVGFDITRRIPMPHGHRVRVTMSGVWSGAKKVGGSLRLRDPKCPAPPNPTLVSKTWAAAYQ